MYEACSTTARRGAIDWSPKFKDALKPVFNNLYDSVKNGTETKRSLDFNSRPDYREAFEKEIDEIRQLEIWRAGKAVRHCTIFVLTFTGADWPSARFVRSARRTVRRALDFRLRRPDMMAFHRQ